MATKYHDKGAWGGWIVSGERGSADFNFVFGSDGKRPVVEVFSSLCKRICNVR